MIYPEQQYQELDILSNFYWKVKPLSFLFKTLFLDLQVTRWQTFVCLLWRMIFSPQGKSRNAKGIKLGCVPLHNSYFATVSPFDYFAPLRVGLLLLQGAKFTRGIPTDHSDSRSDKVRHKKYSWLKIIFLSYRSSRGWILANIDHHPTINWLICKDHREFSFKSTMHWHSRSLGYVRIPFTNIRTYLKRRIWSVPTTSWKSSWPRRNGLWGFALRIHHYLDIHLLLASWVEQRDVGSGPAVLRRCASTLNSPRPAGFVKRCKVLA